MLLRSVRDVMTRLNISMTKLRGQCFDDASAMCETRRGLATQILKEEPRAIYVHCYSHSLNLACSDSVKQCKLMRNALDTVHIYIYICMCAPLFPLNRRFI